MFERACRVGRSAGSFNGPCARGSCGGDTFQDCWYLGPSTRMYVTAWAGPACGLAALPLLPALRRAAHRRGRHPGAAWQGRVAMAAGCLVPVLLLAQLAALYRAYEPDPSGGNGCSGLVSTGLVTDSI